MLDIGANGFISAGSQRMSRVCRDDRNSLCALCAADARDLRLALFLSKSGSDNFRDVRVASIDRLGNSSVYAGPGAPPPPVYEIRHARSPLSMR